MPLVSITGSHDYSSPSDGQLIILMPNSGVTEICSLFILKKVYVWLKYTICSLNPGLRAGEKTFFVKVNDFVLSMDL